MRFLIDEEWLRSLLCYDTFGYCRRVLRVVFCYLHGSCW